MSITIKEIAKLAGVSRGTVDRVLNNRGQVASEVKDRVLKIARDFNYQKNVLASRLAIGKDLRISIVLPDPKQDVFWEAPLNGIYSVGNTMGDYRITLETHFFNLLNSNSYAQAFEKAIYRRPSAILVAPIFLKETYALIQISKHNNIPVVCINSEIESNDILSFVGQDSFQSGMLAGKLFDLSKSEKNQIVVVTQGHDAHNAIHIKKKIEGVNFYTTKHKRGFEIIDLQINDFNNLNVLEEQAKFIHQKYSDLKGIFFSNSKAYNFLLNSSLFERLDDDVTIIGYDLIDKNVELLNQDRIDFILNQKPEMQGYYGLMSLFDHFIFKKTIEKKQYLPIDIVVKENLQSYLNEIGRFSRTFI